MQKIYNIITRLKDNSIPKTLRKKIICWFLGNEHYQEKENALRKIWLETTTEYDNKTENALIRFKKRRKTEKINFMSWSPLKCACIVLLPLLGALCTYLYLPHTTHKIEFIECYVPKGKQKTIQLPDGSIIELNSDSYFSYPSQFQKNKRTVYLLGEAHFAIKKIPSAPFILKTGILHIEVLGTEFNVEAYPESKEVTTSLESGSVKAYEEGYSDTGFYIHPNEKITYDKIQRTFSKSTINAEISSSWRQGNLVMNGKTIEQILKTIERHYNVTFIANYNLYNTDLYNLRIFPNESIEEIIEVLSKLISGSEYNRNGTEITISKK